MTNLDRPVDKHGVPSDYDHKEHSAPYCPAKPCDYCKGHSVVIKANGERQTSWEWCQELNTCAATVDWDKVYGH